MPKYNVRTNIPGYKDIVYAANVKKAIKTFKKKMNLVNQEKEPEFEVIEVFDLGEKKEWVLNG
jgi:hypothetical protein